MPEPPSAPLPFENASPQEPSHTSDETVLFQGTRFNVHSVRATLPDGNRIEKQVIRQPGAVVILPLLDEDRVVMIHNYRYSVGRSLLELPAGTREADEPPEVTASRELIEETGYTAARIEYVQSFFAAPGNCDEEMFLFVATGLTPNQPRREIGELIENQILTWTEIEARLQANAFADAKTLIGLLLGLRRRFQA